MTFIYRFSLIFLLSIVSIEAKDRIYFPYFEGINVANEITISSSKLLRDLSANSEVEIILPNKFPEAYPSEDDIIKEAILQNCNYFLLASLNKLGEKIYVNFNVKFTKNSQIRWADNFKVQNSDEIELIIRQAYDGFINNTKVNDKQQSINTIPENETKPINQKEVIIYYGLNLGGDLLLNSNTKSSINPGFGLEYYFDIRNFIFNANASIFGNANDLSKIKIQINLNTLPSDLENTVYYGGNIGIDFVGKFFTINNSDNSSESKIDFANSGSGLCIGANVGYLFGRGSTTSFKSNLESSIGFYSVKRNGVFVYSYPLTIRLTVGILIKDDYFRPKNQN